MIQLMSFQPLTVTSSIPVPGLLLCTMLNINICPKSHQFWWWSFACEFFNQWLKAWAISGYFEWISWMWRVWCPSHIQHDIWACPALESHIAPHLLLNETISHCDLVKHPDCVSAYNTVMHDDTSPVDPIQCHSHQPLSIGNRSPQTPYPPSEGLNWKSLQRIVNYSQD